MYTKTFTFKHINVINVFRVDGYTSDTTAFADDDEDFSVPLHVNTRTPLRTEHTSPQAPDRYNRHSFCVLSLFFLLDNNKTAVFLSAKGFQGTNGSEVVETTVCNKICIIISSFHGKHYLHNSMC